MNSTERAEVYKWSLQFQNDGALMKGVEKDMPFDDFSNRTRCPEVLRERYEYLLDEKRREDAKRNDLFLKGFMGD